MPASINIELINKLKNLTDTGKVRWESIPKFLTYNKNEPLRKYIIGINKYFYASKGPLLMEYQSYCAPINEGTVVILKYGEYGRVEYRLALQPNSSSLVEALFDNERFQADLHDLYENYIERSLRNQETFIAEILGME